MLVPWRVYIYLPRSSKGCVSWMMFGVPKNTHHSLGFKQHPYLEDAGMYI